MDRNSRINSSVGSMDWSIDPLDVGYDDPLNVGYDDPLNVGYDSMGCLCDNQSQFFSREIIEARGKPDNEEIDRNVQEIDDRDDDDEDEDDNSDTMDPELLNWSKRDSFEDFNDTEVDKKKSDKDVEASKEFCPSSYRNDDFFAESPYFDAFVKKEISALGIVSAKMNDIAEKTEGFAHSGLQMATATHQLASSFKFTKEEKSKKKSIEPEVVDGLERLGDVLDEIASAQADLSRYLRLFIISSMRSISAKDGKNSWMQDEARTITNEAEQLFTKYFNGGKNSWGNLESFGCASKQAARWKCDLLRIRALQTSAELKRYQLASSVMHSKYQQCTDISSCARDIASEMNSYFSHCSNLVMGLKCHTTNMRAKCEEFQLNHHNRHWEYNEEKLYNTFVLTKQTEKESTNKILRSSDLNPCNFDMEEERAQIWDLPATLASQTELRRPRAEGVLAEGWLFRKNGDLPSFYRINTKWSRSWFLARKNGLFELQQFEIKKDSTQGVVSSIKKMKSSSMKKVKLCDLKLCSVRQVPEISKDPSTRFCFELITPSNYFRRLVLRARGPYELNMWLDGIRHGISCQLAASRADDDPIVNQSKHISRSGNKERVSTFMQRFGVNSFIPNSLGYSQQNNNRSSAFPMSGDKKNSVVNKTSGHIGCSSVVSIGTGVISNSSGDSGLLGRRNSTGDNSEIRATILERGSSLFSQKLISSFSDDDNDLGSEVRELMKANPTCADCGKKSPDWVSLNLGILICLECSGFHRSLGVHISKVRSLRLDSLSNRESSLLLSLGNACVNQFWEKETIDDDLEERKKDRGNWIQRKYIKKEFIGSTDTVNAEAKKSCRNLYEASKRADVIGVAKAIIHGGRVNWENIDEDNCTALQVCGISVLGQRQDERIAACKELLLQNGAVLTPEISRVGKGFNRCLSTPQRRHYGDDIKIKDDTSRRLKNFESISQSLNSSSHSSVRSSLVSSLHSSLRSLTIFAEESDEESE